MIKTLILSLRRLWMSMIHGDPKHWFLSVALYVPKM